jgi:hypothetical protein
MNHRLVPRPLGIHENRPVVPEWRCLDCGTVGEYRDTCSTPKDSPARGIISEKNGPGGAETPRVPADAPRRR